MTQTSSTELLMMAFEGITPSDAFLEHIHRDPPAGFTLFRADNVESIEQILELTRALHEANPGELPFLIAIDQEGGQFLALGSGSTPFPGNMALGATGDPTLTEEVGRALGRELRALGIGINYAPIADLNTNPGNPSLGIRSFGDQPADVGRHVAAMVRGLQAEGVAATLKHFPGKGDAQVDSHYSLPVIERDRSGLNERELVPFNAGFDAGAALVMTGHFSIPGLTESADLPSTLSPAILTGLLRAELGFDGAIITDALDMGAISQGAGQIVDAIAAVRAGVDLLLLKDTLDSQLRMGAALDLAARRLVIPANRMDDAVARTRNLRRRFGTLPSADTAAVGSEENRALADLVAAKSITLLRDRAGLLPLSLRPTDRVAAIMPKPKDLTPADTSSFVTPTLAAALREHHPTVDEFVLGDPGTGLADSVADHDLLVVGTISTSMDEAQADLIRSLIATGLPMITVAMRTPYDIIAYPDTTTHLCTYSILEPSMRALAGAMFGAFTPTGRLPVSVSDEFPARFGLGLPT